MLRVGKAVAAWKKHRGKATPRQEGKRCLNRASCEHVGKNHFTKAASFDLTDKSELIVISKVPTVAEMMKSSG